jgi:hypothetical protein
MDYVTWERVPDRPGASGSGGKLGTLKMFSTYWLGGDKPWGLACQLPGYESKHWRDADQDAAKARAERIVLAWLDAAAVTTSDALLNRMLLAAYERLHAQLDADEQHAITTVRNALHRILDATDTDPES